MITNVWNKPNYIAFIPSDDFKQYFTVEDAYCSLIESKFPGYPGQNSDTYIQSYMLDHARSFFSSGEHLNITIEKTYFWKSN